MYYETSSLYIDENSIKTLFLKKTKVNIYKMFLHLDDEILTKKKFKNLKIEFHLEYDKGWIYFTRFIDYKTGRTIFSCTREMIKFLATWKVKGFGHFVVFC